GDSPPSRSVAKSARRSSRAHRHAGAERSVGRSPVRPGVGAPASESILEFSFEEDASWLEDSLRRLRELNKDLDVLLTVSPVASHATFCAAEAVTQSFAGNCVLRAVADRITRQVPRVWYFPAFEMTLAYNPHTFNADNRHVKNSTVDRIFKLLHQTVVR